MFQSVEPVTIVTSLNMNARHVCLGHFSCLLDIFDACLGHFFFLLDIFPPLGTFSWTFIMPQR